MAKRIIMDLDNTVCLPFDGHGQEGPADRYRQARPVHAVIDQMRAYRALGFEIVISTSRNMRTYAGDIDAIRRHTLPIILEWLREHDVPFDEVIVGKPWCGFDGFYVDDRAIRPSEFATLAYSEVLTLIDARTGA